MVTFLPYPEFDDSAKSLDRQRLCKQRVEGMQILKALLFPWRWCLTCNGSGATAKKVCSRCGGGGVLRPAWFNHPAVRMWRGYEHSLALYTMAMCEEWKSRGYTDNVALSVKNLIATYPLPPAIEVPSWLGDPYFHLTHRSRLIAKLPDHYRPIWPTDPDNLEYFWPEEKEIALSKTRPFATAKEGLRKEPRR